MEWIKETPKEVGFYLNRQDKGMPISTVHVVLRPDNVLIGSAGLGSRFFDKCPITEWIGEWYGPVPL